MGDSIHLRQQRIFEHNLWRHFVRTCQSCGRGGESDGWLPVGELDVLLGDPAVVEILMRVIPESSGVEEAAMCLSLRTNIQQYCGDHGTSQLEFRDLSVLLLRLVHEYAAPRTSVGT